MQTLGHLLAGRYDVGPILASGGMADVFAGRDRVLDRPVAIKRLRRADRTSAAASADTGPAREARVLARFAHPNAVSVYDVVDDGEDHWIVMELVAGTTLRSWLRQRGRLPVDEAARIVDQLLAALAAAHAVGVVHRDVTPANVLVLPDGSVKLTDFGLATVAGGAEQGSPGMVVGTPRYLSPEQATGGPASPRSDLYAVGVIAFELVCGTPPFQGDSPADTIAAHVSAPIPELRHSCPGVPGGYRRAVERALAKDPADRFADAETMRAAFRASPAAADATQPLTTLELPRPPVGPGRASRPRLGRDLVVFALLGALVIVAAWAIGRPGGVGGDRAPRVDTPAATTAPARAVPTTVPAPSAAPIPAPSPALLPAPSPGPAPAPAGPVRDDSAGGRDRVPPGHAKRRR